MNPRYSTFREFYPYYLSEHSNKICRRLHFIGSLIALFSLMFILATQTWSLFYIPLLAGYGFAWIGHFFFEKNRPATFRYPLYSFMGDWVMAYQFLTGKIER